MPRAPRPDDLYALRVPTDLRASPDGSRIVFAVKSVAPGRDGYRQAVWIVDADGSAPPRQLTLGTRSDTGPRWAPDGSAVAFLSDRGAVLEAGGAGDRPVESQKPEDGATQVWLLPMAGGEARQLTRFPHDVQEIEWSPDGRRLCVVTGATTAERQDRPARTGDPPKRDARLIDRLGYMENGEGFTYDRTPNLWIVEIDGGGARRLTRGRHHDRSPAWSPDGGTIAFVSDRHPDPDLSWRSDVYLAEAESGRVTRLTGGRGDRVFDHPAWSPDGAWVAAVGHRFPSGGNSRPDLWRFRAAPESEGENLTAHTDLTVGATMNSDLFGGAQPRLLWSPDGAAIAFPAPIDGSYELWRVGVRDREVERLTTGRHYLSRFDLGAASDGAEARVAATRVSAHEPPEIVTLEIGGGGDRDQGDPIRRLSNLNGEALADVDLVAPVERWHEVDGRRIQGWFYEAPRRDGRPAPLVVEIHGGPATLYGWSLMWEWQCLVAAGISVYACNPRGSEGYGEAFLRANYRDWGEGPMRDVMGGVDALISDELVDPARMGVTGGSYGGYLTTWIVGHTDRFAAAVTCRSVSDMSSEMTTGDIAGPNFGRYEYGANPWEDPELYRLHSPLTYADRIRTPLLIQHAENDLRTPIGQAEELFTVLRSLKRTVRLMRAPDETHELTRSGTPFRRVENLERIRDWFVHFLVEGKRGLPPT